MGASCCSSILVILAGLLMRIRGDNWNFITITKPRKYFDDFRFISEVHPKEVSNCSYVVEGGFLKEKCLIHNSQWYFKCPNSFEFYHAKPRTCGDIEFTNLCSNDTSFYQACGHDHCNKRVGIVNDNPKFDSSVFGVDSSCGKLICRIPFITAAFSVSPHTIGCEHRLSCLNIDEGFSPSDHFCDKNLLHKCPDTWETVIPKSRVCDNKCDCEDCVDEAFCNDMAIGIFCWRQYMMDRRYYLPPYKICDSHRDCRSGVDEKGCDDFHETCITENAKLFQSSGKPNSTYGLLRALSPRAKCSVPSTHRSHMVCTDYRDQMNCTGSSISPLLCNVDGYPTTISVHVICKGLNLCDDNLESKCIDVDIACKIHKHRLCDSRKDCRDGIDESDFYCKDLIPDSTFKCVRRLTLNQSEMILPNSWILDGVSDCRNGQDEKSHYWTKRCGFGLMNSYALTRKGSSNCSEVTQFICPKVTAYINLDRLCSGNGFDNCDSKVCVAARKDYLKNINDKLANKDDFGSFPRMFYCVPGLQDLENHAGKCAKKKFANQVTLMGVPDLEVLTSVTFARSQIKCNEIFGDLYVYVACAGICNDRNQLCPLKPLRTSYSCLNYPTSRVFYSLGDDAKLGLSIIDRRKSYSKAFFSCKNGNCITFDQLCNLADDCGDLSDEKNCSNNFKCAHSGEYIPFTSKCDGKFDCYDYSDECNDKCSNHVTMFDNIVIKIMAWIFGILGTSLNAFTFIHGIHEYRSLKTETAVVNKVFVLLITFGDFLQGLFLLVLSIGEQFFNKSTCITQFDWITSGVCTFLGILSTIGSLVSLYSMTTLSVIRASKVKSMIRPREGLSQKTAYYLVAAVGATLFLSIFISVFPMVALEDYFVENLSYNDNPLLVGAPNKKDHLKIIEAYYGRIKEDSSKIEMPWQTLRNLIKSLFANHEVVGTNIGFYGSNGFCLFSYFVRKQTSFRWFSMSILLTNLLCVLIIVVCYVIITLFALKSSDSVAKNPQSEKNNKKLQRKITIIIMTDVLAWLPFIIVCIINFVELIDTSSWYSVFCIFFLPINTIINPIGIYDETIFKCIKNIALKLKVKCSPVSAYIRKLAGARKKEPPVEIELAEMKNSECQGAKQK